MKGTPKLNHRTREPERGLPDKEASMDGFKVTMLLGSNQVALTAFVLGVLVG